MPKHALVAGASGLVGRHLVDDLLAGPTYSTVSVLVRKPLPQSHSKLRQIETDFSDLSALGSRLEAQDVFCCLGTTMRTAGSKDAFRRVDYAYPLALGQAAQQRGALQFLTVSSLGADPHARSFYLRTKGELEEALHALGFTSLVIVRPSLLLGARDETRPSEALAKAALRLLSPLLRGSLSKVRPIRAATVARAMVTLAGMGLYGRHVIESDRMQELG